MPTFPGTPGPDRLTGTDEDDILVGAGGSEGDDILDGRRGADQLHGGGGNDILEGGDGDDVLDGGYTNETAAVTYGTIVIYGGDFASYRTAANGVAVDLRLSGAPQNTGQGADTLHNIEGLNGSDHADQLFGNDLNNTLVGFAGADRLFGNGGNDILLGGDGDDHIEGGGGDDRIWGGAGLDVLRGGAGNDTISIMDEGADDVDGGDGDDTVIVVGQGQTVSGLQGGAGIDTLHLGNQLFLENFSAANGFERFLGFHSNHYVRGTSGDNFLDFSSLTAVPDQPFTEMRLHVHGGAGNDTIIGLAGDGRDVLYGDGSIFGPGGDDTLYGRGGDDELSGDGGNDRLYGGDGNDVLYGGDGDDLLLGQAGNDVINGEGGGRDDVDGGDGDDTITIGGTRSLQAGAGVDTLLIGHYAVLSGFGADNGFERFGGSVGDGALNGTEAGNIFDFSGLTALSAGATLLLRAGAGDDVITGVNGASNNLFGQTGADVIRGGDRNDWLGGAEDDDEIYGGDGNDRIEGGEGSDRLFGGRGDDSIAAGLGDDAVDGGEGVDTVNFIDFRYGGVVVSLQAGVATGEGTDLLISIENVIGTYGGDKLTGSNGANRLDGGEGKDVLIGLGGDDVLIGGLGLDRATYSGLMQGYGQVSGGFNGLTVRGGSEGGTDTVSGVETVQFLDGALSFDTNSWESIVYRMYDAAFDRAPDPFGMKGWAEALAGGMNLRVLSDTFEASAEFQARYGALNNTDFITEMYRFSLNREPDLPGLAHWQNNMAGGMSRAEVLFHFSEAVEHKNVMAARILSQGMWIQDENTIAIARLYDSILDRLPTAAELRNFRGQMTDGATLLQVAQNLMALPDHAAVYGGLGNQQFVEKLYLTVLNRAGTSAEIASNLALLNGGTARADLLVNLSQSLEHAIAYQRTWNQQVRTLETGLYPNASPDEDGKAHHAEVSPVLGDDAGDAFVLPGQDGDKTHHAEVSPMLIDEVDAWNAHVVRTLEIDRLIDGLFRAEVSPVAPDDGDGAIAPEVSPPGDAKTAADGDAFLVAADTDRPMVLPAMAEDAAQANGFDAAAAGSVMAWLRDGAPTHGALFDPLAHDLIDPHLDAHKPDQLFQ